MDEASSSSSSSSEDEKPPRKLDEEKESSSSDFESRPVSRGAKSPKAAVVLKTSPGPNAQTNMNASVVAAIAKGTSKDFMSKMNAAMVRSLHPKSPAPSKKLNRIGFDNDQSSSSDNMKVSAKNTIDRQIVPKKNSSSSESSSEERVPKATKSSPLKVVIQPSTKDSSSSDSDSSNRSVVKEEIPLKNQEIKPSSTSEDTDSDSSKPRKAHKNVSKQVSFSESPTVFEVNQKTPKKVSDVLTETDSDSEDDSKMKQIEEMKKALKKMQASRKRRRDTSEDSDSDSDAKDNSSKIKSKTIQVSGHKSDSNSSDDDKMTSILTQRETPHKKVTVKNSSVSESGNSTYEDSSKKNIKKESFSPNKQEAAISESDTEDNSALKGDTLFSDFLSGNTDFKEIKIKSTFDSANLTKHDEIYYCSVPKYIPTDLLLNKSFSINELATLNFGLDKFNIQCRQFKNKKKALCLVNRKKNTVLINMDITGQVKFSKATDIVQIDKQINLKEVTSANKVIIPELKERHPIFGSDLSKVILTANVQNKLDSMIKDLNKRISKSKKKKSKLDHNSTQENDGQIIKEDIYKMLNFLQEASVVDDKVIDKDKGGKKRKKSKKMSSNDQQTVINTKDVRENEEVVEPPSKKLKTPEHKDISPKKSKKSKLKLNLSAQVTPKSKSEHLELGLANQIYEKKSKKSKRKNDMSLLNNIFLETNEAIIPVEPSKSQGHSEKTIKKVSKGKLEEKDSDVTKLLETKNSKKKGKSSLKHVENVIKDVFKEMEEYIPSNISTNSQNIGDSESVAKKKKKKKKDQNKSGDSIIS